MIPIIDTNKSQTHLPIELRDYAHLSGTVLAFDFGEKRIGVAMGETITKIAHPLETIDAEQNEVKFAKIKALSIAWQPVLLVVGLPTHLDGTPHAMTMLAKKFAQRLAGRFDLPVTMMDERLTSDEAELMLKEQGVRGKNQKLSIDQVAAQLILQSYFDQLKS